MKSNFLPYDTYERHKKVGSFISRGETVLDVGGALNHLDQFSSPGKIVVANLEGMEKSDMIIKKGKLPFGKNSFDVVCAIDVLEHIENKDKGPFLEDLFRVAVKKVILSFPLGTEAHNRYEKQMLDWLQTKGQNVKYLEEHIKYKLPTTDQITTWTKGKKASTIYSGNININEYLFKLHLFDPNIKYIRKLTYFLKLLFNATTNAAIYSQLSQRQLDQNVNRAYLVLEK